jgi:hypothetical protein
MGNEYFGWGYLDWLEEKDEGVTGRRIGQAAASDWNSQRVGVIASRGSTNLIGVHPWPLCSLSPLSAYRSLHTDDGWRDHAALQNYLGAFQCHFLHLTCLRAPAPDCGDVQVAVDPYVELRETNSIANSVNKYFQRHIPSWPIFTEYVE